MKKIAKLISIFLILAISSVILFACINNKIESIAVTEGSLKSVYALDEELNLENATLSVTYKGKVETVTLLRAMLTSDFDTSMPGEKSVTIIYKEKTTVFNYTVTSETEIDSPFRLTMEKTKNSSTEVVISTKNADKIIGGVYAVSFEVAFSGVNFVSITQYVSQTNFNMTTLFKDNILRVVIYSKSGYTPLTADGILATLTFSKIITERSFSMFINNINISNGIEDFINMPSFGLAL